MEAGAGADQLLCGRWWAAQRTPIQLRSRSIAAPGRASRLGFDSCNRLLCQPGATTSLRARPGRLGSGPGGPREGRGGVILENQDIRDGPDLWSGASSFRVCVSGSWVRCHRGGLRYQFPTCVEHQSLVTC